jgi:DNA (cytosine-5)-methyltransferase 1
MPTCIEFYCGIGGFAAVAGGLPGAAIDIRAAIDIDRGALDVYAANFPAHRVIAAEIRSLAIDRLEADLWWLSPPCLPFTRKGNQRDGDDPRTDSLVSLINKIGDDRDYPRFVGIENVPPFAQSQTGQWVEQRLRRSGFETAWEIRCPTQIGVPMRRLRAYLVASREGLRGIAQRQRDPKTLGQFLDAACDADPSLEVPQEQLRRYATAIDRVDPDSPDAVASCFTSSYGRMPVRSGSYIVWPSTGQTCARYFSPDEILRLLGFPAGFVWPDSVSRRRRYAMAGNSLALPIVAQVLTRLIDVEGGAVER